MSGTKASRRAGSRGCSTRTWRWRASSTDSRPRRRRSATSPSRPRSTTCRTRSCCERTRPVFGLDPARIGTWGRPPAGTSPARGGHGDPNDPRGDTSVQAVGDASGRPTSSSSTPTRSPDAQYLVHDDPSSPESRLVGFDGPGEGIGVLAGLPGAPSTSSCSTRTPSLPRPGRPPFLVVQRGTAPSASDRAVASWTLRAAGSTSPS